MKLKVNSLPALNADAAGGHLVHLAGEPGTRADVVALIVNRGLSASTFLYVSMLILPGALALILPIALFAALLFVYQRLRADSELVVMSATGLGPWDLARPALLFPPRSSVSTEASTSLMPRNTRSTSATEMVASPWSTTPFSSAVSTTSRRETSSIAAGLG